MTAEDLCSLGDGLPVRARGWCYRHYMRWYAHGDPLVTRRILGDDRARFEAKVDRSGGPAACHPWLAAVGTGGYGYFFINGRMRSAHIVAWEFTNGPTPSGQELDHECHNSAVRNGTCRAGVCSHRTCCNESHLKPKTRLAHRADTEPFEHARGTAHGRAKLTREQIPEIRELLASGKLSLREIGLRFGVGHGTIAAIKAGRTWST